MRNLGIGVCAKLQGAGGGRGERAVTDLPNRPPSPSMRDDWRLYATPAERAEIERIEKNKQRRAQEEREETPALRVIRERCYQRRRYATKTSRPTPEPRSDEVCA